MAHPHFKQYTREVVSQYTTARRFETKIGERIEVIAPGEPLAIALEKSDAEYVIIGIPEDLGVAANAGITGTSSLWPAFLSSFLNMQNNDFLSGEHMLLLGHFDFRDLQEIIESNAQSREEKILAYRHAVKSIDEEVESLVKLVTSAHKMPVVIGGGHNNAYPLIRGVARGLYKAGHAAAAAVNCVNLDAHTDYRPMEGRHSGNAFRYAMEDGYLKKYFILGAHENYVSQNVHVDMQKNQSIRMISFEDIFVRGKMTFLQAVAEATAFTDNAFTGIELDLDAIEAVLSSAMTSAGVSATHARQYIHFLASKGKPAYLHICEGAIKLSDGRTSDSTGKLVAYLVSDFIKACS